MAIRYTIDEQRNIAIGATKAYLRRMDIEPLTRNGDDAFVALGDLSRAFPDLIAAKFYYHHVSNAQYRKFVREWDRWASEAKK